MPLDYHESLTYRGAGGDQRALRAPSEWTIDLLAGVIVEISPWREKRTLCGTSNYYLGSSSPWHEAHARVRVVASRRMLASAHRYHDGSYNHYYQSTHSRMAERNSDKIAVPDITWKRITIGDGASSSTWFRELYVPSSNCTRRPRALTIRAQRCIYTGQ